MEVADPRKTTSYTGNPDISLGIRYKNACPTFDPIACPNEKVLFLVSSRPQIRRTIGKERKFYKKRDTIDTSSQILNL